MQILLTVLQLTGHPAQIELVHSFYFSVLHINVLRNFFICFKKIAIYQDAQNESSDHRVLTQLKKNTDNNDISQLPHQQMALEFLCLHHV